MKPIWIAVIIAVVIAIVITIGILVFMGAGNTSSSLPFQPQPQPNVVQQPIVQQPVGAQNFNEHMSLRKQRTTNPNLVGARRALIRNLQGVSI